MSGVNVKYSCLMASFLPKASTTAVTRTEESGRHGVHVFLLKQICPVLVMGARARSDSPARADLCSQILDVH